MWICVSHSESLYEIGGLTSQVNKEINSVNSSTDFPSENTSYFNIVKLFRALKYIWVTLLLALKQAKLICKIIWMGWFSPGALSKNHSMCKQSKMIEDNQFRLSFKKSLFSRSVFQGKLIFSIPQSIHWQGCPTLEVRIWLLPTLAPPQPHKYR